MVVIMDRTRGPGKTLVPILLYHAVTDTPGEHIAPFSVSPREFERQLDSLLAAGYRCLSFSEYMSRRTKDDGNVSGGDGRVAVLTFDDGFADFAESALPAMRARGLPSTLYVTTGWLADAPRREPGPSDRMLSWSQLPELVEQGVELGAHSHSHPHMDTVATAAVLDELRRPKELMEDELGRPVPSFAYPHGYHGPRVRRLTERAGYESAAAVRNSLTTLGDHPFSVSRLTVLRATTPEEFSGWLSGAAPATGDRGEALRTKGWRAYRRARAVTRRGPGSDYR
jgi:peptidoglycan/xylan/chitin deacetylase (PgdA/CDA1 family)